MLPAHQSQAATTNQVLQRGLTVRREAVILPEDLIHLVDHPLGVMHQAEVVEVHVAIHQADPRHQAEVVDHQGAILQAEVVDRHQGQVELLQEEITKEYLKIIEKVGLCHS